MIRGLGTSRIADYFDRIGVCVTRPSWVGLFCVGLAGCFGFVGTADAKTYLRGAAGEPETLNPQQTATVHEANIMRDLFEGLVSYDSQARIIPGVAESWTISVDGKTYTYTFTLRSDAKWSNGDPVTADDFVFSWRNILNPDSAARYATNLFVIKNAPEVNDGSQPLEALGVRAVDPTTLEVTLTSPTPYFIQLLAHPSLFPVHPPTVKKYGANWSKVETHVSNGAYVVKSYVPKNKLVLTTNPYFREANEVKIDEVHCILIEDRAAGIRLYAAGEIHSYDDLPVEELATIKSIFGDQVHIAPTLGTYYYAVRTDVGFLKDRRVRQALSMAIDRDFIAGKIWNHALIPAYALAPPGIGNYPNPVAADFKDMDQLDRDDFALKLLRTAGYGPENPISVEIRYNTSENSKNTAVAIADMWKSLGVNTTLVNSDVASHYALLRRGDDYQIASGSWVSDYNDPYNFFFLLRRDSTAFNYAHYSNPEYDSILDRALRVVDLDKRAELLRGAEALLNRDQPFLPILHYASLNIVSDKLLGWEENIQDAHPSRFLDLDE